MCCCLFVYGTLAPGQTNHHLLQPLRGIWQRGWIQGTLYPEGIGQIRGYPVVDLEQPAKRIDGHVLLSEDLPGCWAQLDAYEGPGYQRVRTRVHLDDETSIEAWVYALDPLFL